MEQVNPHGLQVLAFAGWVRVALAAVRERVVFDAGAGLGRENLFAGN